MKAAGGGIDGDEFIPVMDKFYSDSIGDFNDMQGMYDKLGQDINTLAQNFGKKKCDFEEFYAFWREFYEEFDKNQGWVEKILKEEAKARRKAAGGKKGKKPKKSAKSIRKKP